MENLSGAQMRGPAIELPVHRTFKETVLSGVYIDET
jgi:hypothetical protein